MKCKVSIVLALISLIPFSSAFATPHCETCPYDCDELSLGHKDCNDLAPRGNTCCVDLSKKGLELVDAQDEVEQDDEEKDEECPSGYEESENKCTSEERAEGCKDVRLDNGKGCVSR